MPAALLPSPPAVPALHPDAELLALGAEMDALLAAFDKAETDPACDRLAARLAAVQNRIAVLVPRTPAGLAVRLRLAWGLSDVDGTEHRHGPQPYSNDHTRLLWALIRDAERMAFPSAA
ncbi:hypothetical protein [Azospirillum agricola]|uniref:hypothetical protein n=1 Tax=Azospirillum agricola TaxID=1720247 RepID=UPI0011781831|nr:hypothetical protein [Azospirillum agricola]